MSILLQSILPFAGILLGLVVIHEAGHYITAKIFGVRVLEAGIGLPPRIWGFKWRGTDYTINALPLGAFVRLLGEEDPNDPERKALGEQVLLPDSLAAQPKWKRTIIIGAGAVINLIAAVVLFSVGLMIPHPVSVGGAKIALVAPQSPAAAAGLQEGDEILKVNGRDAQSTQDAAYLLRLYQGSNIDLTLKRPNARDGSQIVTTSVYSRWNPQNYTDACGVTKTSGPIGIQIAPVSVAPVSLTAAERAQLEKASQSAWRDYKKNIPPGAAAYCYAGTEFGFRGLTAAQCSNLDDQSRAEAEALKADLFGESTSSCVVFQPGPQFEGLSKTEWQPPWTAIPDGARLSYESLILFRNQIWSWTRGFVDPQVAGPVGIAQATGEVVNQAGWLSLINFAALLSMNLGVFNLLPLPMVDGGRLMFIFIEFIRRGKRVAPEKEALVHFVGFVAMILFAAVITYFDIVRIIDGGSLLR